MTETTRFVSKPMGIVILALTITTILGLLFWVEDRYSAEEQRSCMDGLVRPERWEPDYADKQLQWASDVRKCMRG